MSVAAPTFYRDNSATIFDLGKAIARPITEPHRVYKNLLHDPSITKETFKEVAGIISIWAAFAGFVANSIPFVVGVKFWDETHKAINSFCFDFLENTIHNILSDIGDVLGSVQGLAVGGKGFDETLGRLGNTHAISLVRNFHIDLDLPHFAAQTAASVIQIYTWTKTYFFPELANLVMDQIDNFAAFAVAIGSATLESAAHGIKFLADFFGAGNIKNMFVICWFSIECWKFANPDDEKAANLMLNKDAQILNALDILKRAAKIVTMGLCLAGCFVGFTYGLSLSIMICGLIATVISLAAAVHKNYMKELAKQQA